MSNESAAAVPLHKPGWGPTHDFIYFRKVRVRPKTRGGIIVPDAENMTYCRCIAVGPGRSTPMGSMRLAPVEPGDYFMINGLTQGVVTEFTDDDGKLTYIMEGTLIVGRRQDIPPHLEVLGEDGNARIVTPANDNDVTIGRPTGLLDPSGKPAALVGGSARSIKVEN